MNYSGNVIDSASANTITFQSRISTLARRVKIALHICGISDTQCNRSTSGCRLMDMAKPVLIRVGLVQRHGSRAQMDDCWNSMMHRVKGAFVSVI